MTYYHQLDPFLIHFFGNVGIRWYSMAYILAVLFAYYAGQYLIKKDRLQIPENKLMDSIVFGAGGAVIGGRLGYCLFYAPGLFLSFDSISLFGVSIPFWGVLKIYEGGMSSHGGILGFLFSQILYSYRHNLSFFSLMDLGALSSAFGIFLGRIANFINGELYGRVVEGSSWLMVRFPSEVLLWSSQPDLYKKQLLSLKEIASSIDTNLVKVSSPDTWVEWVNKASLSPDSVYSSYVSYVSQLITQSSSQPQVKELLSLL